MTRRSSKITWALDLQSGKLVKADRAEYRPGKGRYRCLDERCNRDLTVARSKHGRQHFRHFRSNDAPCCEVSELEKGIHVKAQCRLAILFAEALRRRIPMPLMIFVTPGGIKTVLPFVRADRVVTEWPCPQSGRRVDLALVDEGGTPVLLVEVCHTHAVDDEKRRDLAPYWWIEVEARQVLADTDMLAIRNHGNLPGQLALAWKQVDLLSGTRENGC